MRKMLEFQIGDCIVVPKYGVGKIEAIEQCTSGGETKNYYRFVHPKGGTMFLPCDVTGFAPIGDAAAAKEARYIIGWTGNISAVRKPLEISEIKALQAAFHEGCTLVEAARILRRIFFTKGREGSSRIVQRLRNSVKDRVVHEIAAIEGRSIDEVGGEFNAIFMRR